MGKGFTFDGALMFPFRAAHARSFPWKFALAMAAIGTVLTGLLLYLVRGTFFSMVDTLEQMDDSGTEDVQLIFRTLFQAFGAVLPWLVVAALVSWAVWAMFTTASQRRYIFDEDFSLRFGSDELRMMGVGFVWYAAQSVFSIIILLVMAPVFMSVASGDIESMPENQLAGMVLGRMAIVMLLMLIFLPVYIFFATRFSPVFALTVKEKKFAFGDAWIVSRGRFWPILGAYLIIVIVGGMAVSFAGSAAQMVLMPALLSSPAVMEDIEDLRSLFTPAVVVAMLVYIFIRYFLSGLLMHFVHAPAAFAVRHDPRGGVDDAMNIAEFD